MSVESVFSSPETTARYWLSPKPGVLAGSASSEAPIALLSSRGTLSLNG